MDDTRTDGKSCEAGVKYEDVRKHHDPITQKFDGRTYTKSSSLPCVKEVNAGGATCDKCDFPTPEELAAEENEMNDRYENMMKARDAIVKHCGGPWKRGTPGETGTIDCPVCGKVGSLRFTRSGYNGHIHASCHGCVS